jgi:hypothetical protein
MPKCVELLQQVNSGFELVKNWSTTSSLRRSSADQRVLSTPRLAFGSSPAGTNPLWSTKLVFEGCSGCNQVEGWRGYGGSNKLFSVEQNPFREKQLLKALALFERGLDRQVRGARQNALCECADLSKTAGSNPVELPQPRRD